VVDLFFDYCSIEIVGAEAQRDLRNAGREHDPVRLDVIEIVEQQARDCDVAQIGVAGRLGDVRQRGVIRVKGQRNEGDEAFGFILQLAQLDQVIDALFFRLHVAVEHGGVGM